jgi:hypothetical protein
MDESLPFVMPRLLFQKQMKRCTGCDGVPTLEIRMEIHGSSIQTLNHQHQELTNILNFYHKDDPISFQWQENDSWHHG